MEAEQIGVLQHVYQLQPVDKEVIEEAEAYVKRCKDVGYDPITSSALRTPACTQGYDCPLARVSYIRGSSIDSIRDNCQHDLPRVLGGTDLKDGQVVTEMLLADRYEDIKARTLAKKVKWTDYCAYLVDGDATLDELVTMYGRLEEYEPGQRASLTNLYPYRYFENLTLHQGRGYVQAQVNGDKHAVQINNPNLPCECNLSREKLSYELMRLGKRGCRQCYMHGPINLDRFSSNIFSFLMDLWKLYLGGPLHEQQITTKWGVSIKLGMERGQEFYEVRKLIHTSGLEALPLHQEFNRLAVLERFRPANVKQAAAIKVL